MCGKCSDAQVNEVVLPCFRPSDFVIAGIIDSEALDKSGLSSTTRLLQSEIQLAQRSATLHQVVGRLGVCGVVCGLCERQERLRHVAHGVVFIVIVFPVGHESDPIPEGRESLKYQIVAPLAWLEPVDFTGVFKNTVQ
jgi:hypothetical protein